MTIHYSSDGSRMGGKCRRVGTRPAAQREALDSGTRETAARALTRASPPPEFPPRVTHAIPFESIGIVSLPYLFMLSTLLARLANPPFGYRVAFGATRFRMVVACLLASSIRRHR